MTGLVLSGTLAPVTTDPNLVKFWLLSKSYGSVNVFMCSTLFICPVFVRLSDRYIYFYQDPRLSHMLLYILVNDGKQ